MSGSECRLPGSTTATRPGECCFARRLLRKVAVHAFPSFLEKLGPAEFVGELLERGEQELLDLHEEELLHGVLDMMACKAAVKAGNPLSPGEIEALLARRELVERSSNCPHGRPTTLRLSLRDLEKQFKRTGF